MSKHFVSEALVVCREHAAGSMPHHDGNEPQLPGAFRWRDRVLEVKSVRQRGRSTKVDRGDTYLKRHWFEFETTDGRVATVYYDRAAKRGHPHWWLYAIEE